MSNILNLIIRYLGLPILERLGRFLFNKISRYLEDSRIKKTQKKKEKAIEEAKNPEDIRTAHRNNKL